METREQMTRYILAKLPNATFLQLEMICGLIDGLRIEGIKEAAPDATNIQSGRVEGV